MAALAETFVHGDAPPSGPTRPRRPRESRPIRPSWRSSVWSFGRWSRAPSTSPSRVARRRSPRCRPTRASATCWAGRTHASPQRRSAFQALKQAADVPGLRRPGRRPLPNPLLAPHRLSPGPAAGHDDRTPITPHRCPARRRPCRGRRRVGHARSRRRGRRVGGRRRGHRRRAGRGRSLGRGPRGRAVRRRGDACPTNELAAFDRLYLEPRAAHHLGRLGDDARRGAVSAAATLVNWMTCIDAPPPTSAADWATGARAGGRRRRTSWDDDVAAIEAELGVAEATAHPAQGRHLLRGARALGWEAAPTRRNATGCGDCGSCPFGCRRGAKQSGIRVHLAERRGRRADRPGRRPSTRVLARGRPRDRRRGGTVATDGAAASRCARRRWSWPRGPCGRPAILQRSGLDTRRSGGTSGSTRSRSSRAAFSETVEMWRGTMQAARSLEFGARRDAGRNGYVIESAPGHPGLLALAFPWEGAAAHARVMAGSAAPRPAHRGVPRRRRGPGALTKAGRVRASTTASMRRGSRRSGTAWSGWPASPARRARNEIIAVGTPPRWYRRAAARPAPRRRRRSPRFEAGAGAVRLRAQPRDGVLRPPDGHRSGWAPTRRTMRATRGAASERLRRTSDAVVGGLYVGDGSLFPTGLGRQPDAHDRWRSRGGSRGRSSPRR